MEAMKGGWRTTVKRFILWDYPRGGVPYDIMVVLILAFIFLTPRDIFRDQPKAKNVVMLPAEAGKNVFWLDPGLLETYSAEERLARAEELVRKQGGSKNLRLSRLEAITTPGEDEETEIKGYMAFAEP